MTTYKQDILDLFPFLKEEDIDELLKISKVVSLQDGDKLISQGEVNDNMHLVLKGLLRSYVITSSGEERTVFLAGKKMRSASFQSLVHKAPSEVSIEAIEDSEVLIVNSRIFQQVIKSESSLRLLEKQGIQDLLLDAVERLHFFTVLSPEERYIQFCEKHPDILQRVPQKYLAFYLGVTTVSLSRIKARIAKK